jgi:hypothetical protein
VTFEVHAAALRSLHPSAINTDDVMGVLKPIWIAKPETARRIRERIERVLDAAKAAGLRSGENPARWKGHLAFLLPRRPKLARGIMPPSLTFKWPPLWRNYKSQAALAPRPSNSQF